MVSARCSPPLRSHSQGVTDSGTGPRVASHAAVPHGASALVHGVRTAKSGSTALLTASASAKAFALARCRRGLCALKPTKSMLPLSRPPLASPAAADIDCTEAVRMLSLLSEAQFA